MGWMFSPAWPTRKHLITQLTERNGVETLRHCCTGNNLWCVHRLSNGVKFICLYMMQKHKIDGEVCWGYKDIDESMGPNAITCPVSYLEMCTAPEGPYGYEWRQRVYAEKGALP